MGAPAHQRGGVMIVADPVFYKTVELMAERLARIEEKLNGGDDPLLTLDKILGTSANTARMKYERDEGLKAIGIPCKKRLLFRKTEVMFYFRAKAAK